MDLQVAINTGFSCLTLNKNLEQSILDKQDSIPIRYVIVGIFRWNGELELEFGRDRA